MNEALRCVRPRCSTNDELDHSLGQGTDIMEEGDKDLGDLFRMDCMETS